MDRRDFARLFALGGSAALLGHPRYVDAQPAPLPRTSLRPGAVDWAAVREQFMIPPEVSVLNAANLCPAARPVLETVSAHTERLDSRPFPTYRSEIQSAKETTRDRLATHLRATQRHVVDTQRLQRKGLESHSAESFEQLQGPGHAQ